MEAISHTSRKGDVYYLHARPQGGRGCPFYVAKKLNSERALAEMPDGYKIHENPNGAVSVCRSECEITEIECGAVQLALVSLTDLSENDYEIEVLGKQIAIWLIHSSRRRSLGELGDEIGFLGMSRLSEKLKALARYSAEMRFTLSNKKRRFFKAERYCYRGSVDRWICMSEGSLSEMLKEFVPHLGKESFFDLIGF